MINDENRVSTLRRSRAFIFHQRPFNSFFDRIIIPLDLKHLWPGLLRKFKLRILSERKINTLQEKFISRMVGKGAKKDDRKEGSSTKELWTPQSLSHLVCVKADQYRQQTISNVPDVCEILTACSVPQKAEERGGGVISPCLSRVHPSILLR